MKRVVIVCVLLVCMIGISIYSMVQVSQAKRELDQHIDLILDASEKNDPERLMLQLEELSGFWKQTERKLVHYVRHGHIDEITRAIAKLPSLAAFENYAELSAELFSIKWQMESIWYSEQPIWDNIL